MRIILVFVLSLFASPAFAQQLTIKSNCKAAPTADVEGADYKPGVDVKGKAVEPADIEPAVGAVNYPLVVPIELDHIRTLEMDLDINLDTDVAFVTVYEDGRIEYNGQDISRDVEFLCADAEEDDDPVLVYEGQSSGGQKAPDAVPSGAVEKAEDVTKKQDIKDE